jgi:hypothetical protein
MNRGLVHAIAQHVVHRTVGSVDRKLGEIRAAEPRELRVEVGKQACLHERIVGRFDTGHEVAGVKGHLFGLGEVVGRVPVEGQLSDQLYRDHLLGHDLGRIEQVDALVGVRAVVGHDLNSELVLEKRPGLDTVGHVPSMEVWIAACRDLRLLPDQ